jgi:di/tricarboxylate transporter
MDLQIVITLAILITALVLFLSNKLPADLVALLVVVALGLTGVLTPQEAFSGFSRSAVITIIAIFILAEALQRTGLAEQVGNILLKFGGKSEFRLVVTVMIAGAFLSLFMNNIAAAAVLLPAASGAAKKASVNLSKLLIPLAFGTILGGMATLLTTSNIVLSALLHDNNLEGFGLIDFAPVGIPLVISGILYVALIGRRSLPGESILERTIAPESETQSDLVEAYHLGENLFRARVPEDSFLSGRTLTESTLREKFGVSVVAIERKKKKIIALSPDTEIKKGDTLILKGNEEDFRARDVHPYMEFLPASEWHDEDLEAGGIEVVEAMLAPRSRLIRETLISSHFRERYGMTVLAIWRNGEEIIHDLQNLPLEFGDTLLLQGSRKKLPVLADDPDLLLLMQRDEAEITVPDKGRASLMIFIATLLLAVILPDLTAAVMLGGALAMMLTGILTSEQAYSAIGWKSVFLVGGMLPMGIALSKTNAAGLMANQVVSLFGGMGPIVLLAGLMLLTILLTQAVNGAVVAAVLGPVAIQIAQQTNVNPRGLAMGVAMAASMAFMTPLGHPVNILVMSPGGYSFRDYLKVGLPLTLILFAVAMIFLPIYWQL